ncbi:MAG: two-component system sensor histidine kinase CreC [Leptospiraceae bacterium]|nr:two-component system sensor histidine kinase CreC [Leptospiraceae bacterium]
MSIRFRLLGAFTLLIVVTFYYLFDFIDNNLRPQYLETVEESLNDSAHILAALVESTGGTAVLSQAMRQTAGRRVQARIYGFDKEKVDLEIYVTDETGRVLYDSQGRLAGRDFSEWNDVYLTLRGKYGARSTRLQEDDPNSGALYVAAPIYRSDQITGSLTVVKTKANMNVLVARAEQKMYTGLLLAVALILLFGLLVTLWVTRPIGQVTRYISGLGAGQKSRAPESSVPEIKSLVNAFESLRRELEGKNYIEQYVRSLTHELRSPLSGLEAALEILSDHELNQQERDRFLQNARRESQRLFRLSDHILQLASLENREQFTAATSFIFEDLLAQAVQHFDLSRRSIELVLPQSRTSITAIPLLIEQVLSSIIQNALDFSAPDSRIEVQIQRHTDRLECRIQDEGSGIPDFAIDKIYDKFYSTARADGHRSSGLGLSFVKEVIDLHHGQIEIRNRSDRRGVIVIIQLPYS